MGFLKNVLRVDEEESNQDLVLAEGDEDSDDDGTRLAFDWKAKERRYKRAPKNDKSSKVGFNIKSILDFFLRLTYTLKIKRV